MGNHNRQWIGGRHVVLEALRAGRWLPLEVAVCQVLGETLEEPLELARQLGLPVKSVDPIAMNRLCRGGEHQGLAMRMPEFPYTDLDDLLSTAVRPTALLLLDRIQDSHNFGAILRSAEVFGFDAVIVAGKGQSPVNEQVVRSSAGAIHHLTLVRVPRMDDAIQRIQQAGCRVYGAAPEGSTTLAQVDLARPAALLIGNEGDGITPVLLALCDERVRIPQQGQTGSLNAAVSAGILCYELRRQRQR
jgi:23S rRNA (guanosine2251-2'-O)-methyltransferase